MIERFRQCWCVHKEIIVNKSKLYLSIAAYTSVKCIIKLNSCISQYLLNETDILHGLINS
eukprot:GAHX01005250.1.p1 GENE.GAHX01005250.1~~GAHX01005250.1.p1  ORF type:complete len:60 (-),score=5.93 GAHX01005250.1:291-470(-)